MERIYPGIWQATLGEPETATPVRLRHIPPAAHALARLPQAPQPPIAAEAITARRTDRGFLVELPLADDEQIYGLGLQLLSFNQRGRKKTLRVNSDPKADLGDSHAPVPFYVSTRGYGVLIDTARYATIYCAAAQPRLVREVQPVEESVTAASSAEELYATCEVGPQGSVLIEIPAAAGVDIYLFAGPTLGDAVRRYNLFSGGGCLPTRWGLGVWYRTRKDFDQAQVLAMADDLRQDGMPCDVLGLEGGWQSHIYSCSFRWSARFPDPQGLVQDLAVRHYRTNLWTHAFIHTSAPIYRQMIPYSGDYEVWEGLVPDLTIPEARRIFADEHERAHVSLGIAGYKVDECDNSDFIHPHWSYPEISRFPSGLDGEQMHSVMGIQYQDTLYDIFRKRNARTYNQVRSSHALAAPYPYVLYSDLYRHQDFIRGLVNSGFSGLLWCPEIRHAESAEDLIRRLQTVVLSPQALINAWYIKHAPWKQWRKDDNNADRLLEDWPQLTAACRQVLELRMQLIPYLYAAFFRYYEDGMPPFRALVMDYPRDANCWHIDDQYLLGDRLLAAPVTADMEARDVYLPVGRWHDFWTGEAYEGGRTLRVAVPLERVPLYVKGDALLPLAQPTLHTDDPASLQVTVRVYGAGTLPAMLIEDDGATYEFEQGAVNRVTLAWDAATARGAVTRAGSTACPRYEVTAWERWG